MLFVEDTLMGSYSLLHILWNIQMMDAKAIFLEIFKNDIRNPECILAGNQLHMDRK